MVTTSDQFYALDPIARFRYAQSMVAQCNRQGNLALAKQWEAFTKPLPGGWSAEDEDGNGPWWYVFEEGGKKYVTFRGNADYKLIQEVFKRWRR
jgi:hypothetical protein